MNDHLPDQDGDEIDSIGRENDPKIKYRQYLIDRAKGTSKLSKSKPPCFLCFVPIPVVWAADLVEQNCVFETLGSFGYYSPTNLQARAVCIGLGLLLNILSTILSGYCLFATSEDFDMIWVSAFTSGFIKPGNEEIVPYELTIRMGLKAIAVKTFHTDLNEYVSQEVMPFDQFCDNLRPDPIVPDGDTCDDCDAVSSSIIFSLYVSFLMGFPSITTSVLRLYPHYDCNCQKVFASFAALISVAFAIATFVLYQFRCFRSVEKHIVCIDEEGIGYWPDDGGCFEGIFYHRTFHAGPGWICLSISVGFRILDMLLNMAIPTPTICRDREEQRLYESLVLEERDIRVDQDGDDATDENN